VGERERETIKVTASQANDAAIRDWMRRRREDEQLGMHTSNDPSKLLVTGDKLVVLRTTCFLKFSSFSCSLSSKTLKDQTSGMNEKGRR
jgi:hypothetical protein